MASTAREAFALYLRTGRRASAIASAPLPVEHKFNANHDPENGQFTSGPGGAGANAQFNEAETAQPSTDETIGVRPGATLRRAAEIAEQPASGRHSTGKCYAYVKRALLRAGAVSDYLPGIPAKNAGVDLAKRGFVDLLERPGKHIRSPYDAPVGAVLVYDPTPEAKEQKYGHIEIRTSRGFASDYVSTTARTGPRNAGLIGHGRRLTGVWVKP